MHGAIITNHNYNHSICLWLDRLHVNKQEFSVSSLNQFPSMERRKWCEKKVNCVWWGGELSEKNWELIICIAWWCLFCIVNGALESFGWRLFMMKNRELSAAAEKRVRRSCAQSRKLCRPTLIFSKLLIDYFSSDTKNLAHRQTRTCFRGWSKKK